jgi:FixJ family two-component response regulator
MRTSKAILVVHPDWRVRMALRSLLETHGCTVATDYSCADLLSGSSDFRPDLILVDRSLLDHEGLDVLSQLGRRWDDTEVVFLPEGMNGGAEKSDFAAQLLRIVDRLLQMRTTRDILAV